MLRKSSRSKLLNTWPTIKLADQMREISQKFQGMGTTLAKLEAFEAAVDNLSEMKLVADEQQRAAGDWSENGRPISVVRSTPFWTLSTKSPGGLE